MNNKSASDGLITEPAETSLPAVIVHSGSIEAFTPAHGAILQSLLSDLGKKTPEQVIEGLVQSRAIPPEIATLIREGLLEAFIQVRRLMLVSQTTTKLAETMSATATQILLEYFKSVHQLVASALSLSEDAMRNVEILSIVLSAKDLSAMPQAQLYQGLRGVNAFQASVERIVAEIIRRLADESRADGIGVSPDQIECSSEQSRFTVVLPFKGTIDDAHDTIARFEKAIQPSYPSLQAKFRPYYQAKPGQYMGQGIIEFAFQFWNTDEKTTSL